MSDQDKATKDKVLAYINRAERLSQNRHNWNSHWQEIADYCLPRRATFNREVSKGQKNMDKVFDSTGIWAAEQLAAALHGMLTNPALTWFKLLPEDPRMYDDYEVRVWLEEAERVLYRIFNSPQSNFNSQLHEAYMDLVCFGTSVIYMEELNAWPVARFSARHLGECYVAEGKTGQIDTVYRRFTMPARVAMQIWGEACGPAVKKQIEKNKDADLKFLHAVQPREEREYGKIDAKNKPWASIYLCEEDKWLLSEGGYDDFPYLVPRWSKMVGETYGRAPAMTALPDIKMVNAMSQTIIRAAQKTVDPPLMVPDDGFFLPVKTAPSSMNFYRAGTMDRIEALKFEGRIDIGNDQLEQRRQAILRAFYLDQMKLQKDKVEMTRYEAEVRNQENMRAMSPTIGRLESELLGPCIDRTFEYAQRQGLFTEPPEALKGTTLKTEYVSPIARAQKTGEAGAFQAAMQMAVSIAAVKPDVMEVVNTEEAMRRMPDWFGLPHALIHSAEEVAAMRKQREEQQNMANMASMAREGAAAAKDGAQALSQLGLVGGGSE